MGERARPTAEDSMVLLEGRKWEWSYLRRKCRNMELEEYYQVYKQRLCVSYLSLFTLLQIPIMGVHCIILLSAVNELSLVVPDILAYMVSTIIIWIVMYANLREEFVKKHQYVVYLTSWLSISILVLMDIGITLYHATDTRDILRPTYSGYTIFAIYLFMPLPNYVHPFILGMAVTVVYLINHGMVTLNRHSDGTSQLNVNQLIGEAIFLFCCNMLGIFFRMMQEIAIRTTFLDRRQYVEENLLLRYARDQEKSLLLSIIPAQIANRIEQDVKVRIERLKKHSQHKFANLGEGSVNPQVIKRWRQPDSEKLFIEPHTDVSILYADVVNYTYLTTTLDVKTLVETLHDLFVKFDIASEEYNVLRIKFLGDCYYCVAGVPIPNEDHAKCCVDLGLCMIKDIREVREKRRLNIDMRIGVHSGNILSGVIGACKWQFDIWSKDVDIANRLEQTGMAGRVHVSEQTLQLLDGEYMYEEGTQPSRDDVVLKKYGIRSFLIKATRTSPINHRNSGNRGTLKNQDSATNFMQSTIHQYNQIRTQAKLEMSRELDKMPIGKIQGTKLCLGRTNRLTQDEMEEQNFRRNITSICLIFRDWRWEVQYMNEPDFMLKYSILFGTILFVGLLTIQAVNVKDSESLIFWGFISLFFLILLIIAFIAWYRELWALCFDVLESKNPKRKCSSFLFMLSERMQYKIIGRVLIYLILMLSLTMVSFVDLAGCDRYIIENEEIDIQIFEEGVHTPTCFSPWSVTSCLMLTIAMGFLFTRIPFGLKACVGIIITGIYAIIVVFEFDFVYEKSTATNVGLYADYSHLLVLIITFFIFLLMDCQTEFITKVDYNWKRQLLKKQDDAQVTNDSIKILINNILPAHVADIYISKKMKNELYYEEYDNVAVMFASIRNFDTEKVGLRVLNEIICDFDDVLSFYTGSTKIEKIKVAGWTYMAACGLDVTRSEQRNERNSSLLPNGRRSHYLINERSAADTYQNDDMEITPRHQFANWARYEGHTVVASASNVVASDSDRQSIVSQASSEGSTTRVSQNVVFIMTQFALDLMRTMQSFNLENLQVEDGSSSEHGRLRIGISHGRIMAGVVGSSKPHYDIWGNAVNMASRMDSTGIPGFIQVTQETAYILRTFNIQCNYRGLTFVKGRGEIPTYFVGVDKDFHFIKNSAIDLRVRADDDDYTLRKLRAHNN